MKGGLNRNVISLVAAAVVGSSVSLDAAAVESAATRQRIQRDALLSAPLPKYPTDAMRILRAGSGVVALDVDRASGKVTNTHLYESTGHSELDRAALDTLRRWRFKPGLGVDRVMVPITFSSGGGVRVEFETKSRNMDNVLAPFLGKGTVLYGPIPDYPKSAPWTSKRGKGVYELHVNQQGKVDEVKILASSGDGTFDRVAVGTLRKWRLRRGPLTVELPLSFTLTPDRFAVQIPKHESLRQRKAR